MTTDPKATAARLRTELIGRVRDGIGPLAFTAFLTEYEAARALALAPPDSVAQVIADLRYIAARHGHTDLALLAARLEALDGNARMPKGG